MRVRSPRCLPPLREAGVDREVWSDDQHCTVVSLNGARFVVLSYYKNRGRTEGAWIIDGHVARVLTTLDVQHFLDSTEPDE